jgi:S-formylglutathione hydrolase FrmB
MLAKISWVRWALWASILVGMSAQAGTIATREFDSAALNRKWIYSVYLPTGYEASTAKYPVLYLLHGNAQSHKDWAARGSIQATADALIASGDIPAAVIVMPDASTTWYVDRKEKMETAVLQDLIPDVEKFYRVQTHRGGRFIAGLSMGGYGAMRFAMLYPEKFAAAGLLSPAIYSPSPPANSSVRRVGVFGTENFDDALWQSMNYPALWKAYMAKQIQVPMYINSGDDDDFFIEADATRFYSLLRENKQPAELRIVNGAHAWPVWSSTIGDAMKYLFKYATPPGAAKL